MAETIADLEEQKRVLAKKIRDAKRAERKAEAKALLDAQHGLGEWFATRVGATTPDAVRRLEEWLNNDRRLDQIEAGYAPESVTSEASPGDVAEVENGYPYEHRSEG